MPRGKQYIPVRDDDFYNWQGNFVNLVVVNAADWDIPAPAVAALVSRRAEYEPLYTAAQNKTTRNRTDVRNHRETRATHEKELRAFVKKYCDTLPTNAKSDLGLTIPDTEPSPSPVITDFPIVGLRALGGGDIEVRCRVRRDQTRVSMHTAANLVECRIAKVEVGDIPPSDPEDYRKKEVSSRAKFIYRAGAKNAGKRLYAVLRWINTRRPKQEGPWTEAISVIIA